MDKGQSQSRMGVAIVNREVRLGSTEKSHLMEGVSRTVFQGEGSASARPEVPGWPVYSSSRMNDRLVEFSQVCENI